MKKQKKKPKAGQQTENSREAIRLEALRLGFDAVGFSSASVGTQAKENLKGFLAKGYHGDMGWIKERMDWRLNPVDMWKEAQSVVVLGCNYGPAEDPLALLEEKDRGNVSVYARNRDYHDFIKKRLKALARWMVEHIEGCRVKVFVDTAPVMEKVLAAQAGIGWQGKNTHLVSRNYGSWLFLGEVYCNLTLAPEKIEEDHCGSCSRCLTICPTKAFPAPYQLDARRCISYLTIENKGHIALEFREAIGNRIYGCDDCIAVCPWNKFATATAEPYLYPRIELSAPRLADLAELEDQDFRQIFRGSPIKRIGRNAFVRNVLIALGNSGENGLAPRLYKHLSDPSPLVRAMAVWALHKLDNSKNLKERRKQRLATEQDAFVRQEWDAFQGVDSQEPDDGGRDTRCGEEGFWASKES